MGDSGLPTLAPEGDVRWRSMWWSATGLETTYTPFQTKPGPACEADARFPARPLRQIQLSRLHHRPGRRDPGTGGRPSSPRRGCRTPYGYGVGGGGDGGIGLGEGPSDVLRHPLEDLGNPVQRTSERPRKLGRSVAMDGAIGRPQSLQMTANPSSSRIRPGPSRL